MKSSNTPRPKKKAVLYPRVSTHKQKIIGYSFEDQEKRMLAYCKAFRLEVDEKVFREDYSAKTFKKRKVFQELLKYLKENRKDIGYLLFTKIDRFSRKRDESLEMKKKIEGWGIKVIGIEEPNVTEGPSKLLVESILHTLPEVDNMIRSESVKRGMRAAKRQGRYVAKPPFGYIRIPPKSKLEKSNLAIDKEKAPLVKEVFNRVISGEPVSNIRKSMESKGLYLKKTQVYSMIKNVVYTGKIRIDAWKEKNEPETVVIGLHPAIVSEIIFWAAQNALKKKE